jgi:hypothetical protein
MSIPLSITRFIEPARVLLIRDATRNSEPCLAILEGAGHSVVVSAPPSAARAPLRALLAGVDVVLLDITSSAQEVLKTIVQVNVAMGIANLRPRLLCFSTVRRSPRFDVEVEKTGARYVRIANSEGLLDAINVALAETKELERVGPRFEIVHSYWQKENGCAPGEEVTAVFLCHQGQRFQVPLALSQRLIFNFLASRGRLALDSLQIVSALAGDWFYRDHASNSDHKQVARIRRATVKVLIQRIRVSLASTFAEANLRLRPEDVLRSCLAEGSKRVLYKLRADVCWQHVQ